MKDKIMLVIDDNGIAHEYKKPYATIECRTKEDFERIKEAVGKHNQAKKPNDFHELVDVISIGTCPVCNEGVNSDMNFCSNCGQNLSWISDND